MWYNGSTHTLKRYSVTTYTFTNPQTGLTNTGYNYYWTTIQDQKAIDAYEAASNAQDTADRKRQVFVSTPYGPYDIGDLWLRSWTDSTGVARKDLYRCTTARASGYNANDWVIATFYDNTQVTIDSGIVTAGTVQLANGNSQSIVAGITGGEKEAATEEEERKVRIWAGASKENRFTAPFRVTQDGSLYATKGEFSGYLRTPFIEAANSDAIRLSDYALRLNKNLNILSHGYGEIIEFPNSADYIGARVLLYNDIYYYSRTDQTTHIRVQGGGCFYGALDRNSATITTESNPEYVCFQNYILELVGIPDPQKQGKCGWIILNYNPRTCYA